MTRTLDWKWIGIGVVIMIALNIVAGIVLGIVGSVVGVLMTIVNAALLMSGSTTFDFDVR